MPRIVVESGPLRGRRLQLPSKGAIAVGHDARCALRLPEDRAAPIHCVLRPAAKTGESPRWFVEDRSGGRTLLNDRPVRRKALSAGDVIRVGDTAITFHVAEEDPLVGEVIGGCRIERLLGKGAMGTVYAARQLSLDRKVALKLLSPRLASDESFIKRFLEEARSAGRLSHANVVQVYDAGRSGEHHYISMEFLERGTLEELISRTDRLSPPAAIAMGIDAARALAFAESNHIVHRDIKPANLLISADGHVKVGDLGIASDLRRKAEEKAAGDSGTKGEVAGSPRYMAPEQALGKKVDQRADIYALGGTLYRALSGRPPFDGPSVEEILRAKVEGDPVPLHEIVPNIPESLSHVVQKMLARYPKDRYSSAREVEAALTAIVERGRSRREAAAEAAGSSGRRGLAVSAALLGLALVVGALVYVALPGDGKATREDGGPVAVVPAGPAGSADAAAVTPGSGPDGSGGEGAPAPDGPEGEPAPDDAGAPVADPDSPEDAGAAVAVADGADAGPEPDDTPREPPEANGEGGTGPLPPDLPPDAPPEVAANGDEDAAPPGVAPEDAGPPLDPDEARELERSVRGAIARLDFDAAAASVEEVAASGRGGSTLARLRRQVELTREMWRLLVDALEAKRERKVPVRLLIDEPSRLPRPEAEEGALPTRRYAVIEVLGPVARLEWKDPRGRAFPETAGILGLSAPDLLDLARSAGGRGEERLREALGLLLLFRRGPERATPALSGLAKDGRIARSVEEAADVWVEGRLASLRAFREELLEREAAEAEVTGDLWNHAASEAGRILLAIGPERADVRDELSATFASARQRALLRLPPDHLFHASRAEVLEDGRISLRYDFASAEELADFREVLPRGSRRWLRSGKLLEVTGEVRFLEGEPFTESLAIHGRVERNGFDAAAPNIDLALWTGAEDKVTPGSGGAGESGSPPDPEAGYFAVGLGYRIDLEALGLRLPRRVRSSLLYLREPTFAIFYSPRGAPLHTDPRRELIWEIPAGDRLGGAVDFGVVSEGGSLRWTLEGRSLPFSGAKGLERIARGAPYEGSVTFFTNGRTVRYARLRIEGRLRPSWLRERAATRAREELDSLLERSANSAAGSSRSSEEP